MNLCFATDIELELIMSWKRVGWKRICVERREMDSLQKLYNAVFAFDSC